MCPAMPATDRNFPGLGMAARQPRGFVVAWDDAKGREHTTQTVPTHEAAVTLMEEIAKGDAANRRASPQRGNLRVIQSKE